MKQLGTETISKTSSVAPDMNVSICSCFGKPYFINRVRIRHRAVVFSRWVAVQRDNDEALGRVGVQAEVPLAIHFDRSGKRGTARIGADDADVDAAEFVGGDYAPSNASNVVQKAANGIHMGKDSPQEHWATVILFETHLVHGVLIKT